MGDSISNLDDFLRAPRKLWNLDAITDELVREQIAKQLYRIRITVQEGRDYTEMSGIGEVLGGDVADETEQPWRLEAERRLSEILEQYELSWGAASEMVVRKR